MSANRETGEVTFEAGGRTYTLVLDLNAMTTVEGHFSTPEVHVPLPVILDHMNRGSVTHMRVFLWAALHEKHPELTLEEVGRLVTQAGGLAAFTEKVTALVASLRPDAADLHALGVVPPKPSPSGARPRSTGPRARSPMTCECSS